jgi:hypothetical protein
VTGSVDLIDWLASESSRTKEFHSLLNSTRSNRLHAQPTTPATLLKFQKFKMSALNKIAANSPSRQKPSELETNIAGALYDLETNTTDLKAALRPLQFTNAREVS